MEEKEDLRFTRPGAARTYTVPPTPSSERMYYRLGFNDTFIPSALALGPM